MSNEESIDNLPRFAATREFLTRYGKDWASWVFVITGLGTLGIMALAFTDAVPAPAAEVLPAMLSFGVVAFIGGFFGGAIWCGLIDQAKERFGENDE